MFKKLFQKARQGIQDTRTRFYGELAYDLGKVWTSEDGKRAFFVSIYEKDWESVISLGCGSPQIDPNAWLYPVTEGTRLVGDFATNLDELALAAERGRTGATLEPDNKGPGIGISSKLLHRGLTDTRLLFSHSRPGSQTRLFHALQKGEPTLLVVEDSGSDPTQSFSKKLLDGFEDAFEKNQSSLLWPLEGFFAAVKALENSREEVLTKLH